MHFSVCHGRFLSCYRIECFFSLLYFFLTKITAGQNEVALSYDRVRGLYFLAGSLEPTIVTLISIIQEAKSGGVCNEEKRVIKENEI